jgi:hypothetical protein
LFRWAERWRGDERLRERGEVLIHNAIGWRIWWMKRSTWPCALAICPTSSRPAAPYRYCGQRHFAPRRVESEISALQGELKTGAANKKASDVAVVALGQDGTSGLSVSDQQQQRQGAVRASYSISGKLELGSDFAIGAFV